MNVVCPICDSKNISIVSVEKSGTLTLGHPFTYLSPQHKCADCGEVGNFGMLEDGYEAAREQAEKELAVQLIEHLERGGSTLQDLERAFELPFRTMSRWKTGKCSASGLALLRIATAVPFITNIAAQKFSRESVIRECGSYFVYAISDMNLNPTWHLQETTTTSSPALVKGALSAATNTTNWSIMGNGIEAVTNDSSSTVQPLRLRA